MKSKTEKAPKQYHAYYRVTANNTEGSTVTTISDVTGFNEGDYVVLTFPKPKRRLTQRLKQIVNQLRHRKNAKESK